MIIIGLHGPMRSGKDTASEIVHEWAEERGVFAVRRAFADLLKFSLYRMFYPTCTMEMAVRRANEDKFSDKQIALEDRMGQGIHISIREALQRYGIETHRDVFDPDFWVNQILPRDELERIRAIMRHSISTQYPEIVTITDVRFENEAERILEVGGQVWRIVRPGLDLSDAHISEAILPERLVTRVLDNHRDLADFRLHVRALCEQLPVGGDERLR